MTYDDIKSNKKAGLYTLFIRHIFQKTTGHCRGGKNAPFPIQLF